MSFVTFQTPACEVCGEPATNKIDGAYLCAHHATILEDVKIVLVHTWDDEFNKLYLRRASDSIISKKCAQDLWRKFIGAVDMPPELA